MSSFDRSEIAAHLAGARARTLELVSGLSSSQLLCQVSPLQSPLSWDLAHIGHFEELWLLRRVGGLPALHPEHDDVYDAFAHLRSERGELAILEPPAARAFLEEVRRRVLGLLADVEPDGDPLLQDGFAFGMVAQHELQHGETMAQTLQLAGFPLPTAPQLPEVRGCGELHLAGGAHLLGAGADERWAYDNERPARELEVPAFRIDRGLVTNREYANFVDGGGYGDRSAWSHAGWEWREAQGAQAPLYWERRGAAWWRRRFDALEPLPPDEPVMHVSLWEAEAYARSAGKRLPSEPEWEAAARSGELEHAAGAVWQWTSSPFEGYPGFRVFPYAEYSEVFFGGAYRVLRGGSWVTDPLVSRVSFRSWDHPQRRQIFAGIRCAHDA